MYSVRAMVAPTATELEALTAAFDTYRGHYGEPAEPRLTTAWLAHQLQTGGLNVVVAEDRGRVVGFATCVRVPASLRLGHWWQIRDLFVVPEYRRRGIALALLAEVRSAAETAGALRVGLQTEETNDTAIAVYRRAGYVPVPGYLSLILPLAKG